MKKIISQVPYVGFVLLLIILRLMPHIPNFAPIGAATLLAGYYTSSRKAIILPIIVMLISDLFLGFHSAMVWVYGSYILTALMAIRLKGNKSVPFIAGGSILSSILFYLLTNFGVWLSGTMYEKTVYGLFQCYTMAIPFFRNTVLSDLIYTAVFFTVYAVLRNHKTVFTLFRGDATVRG